MSDKKLPPEFEHTDQKNTEQQPGQRALTRRDFVKIAGTVAAVGAGVGLPKIAAAKPTVKTKIDTPAIACGTAGTDYIDIQVCAPSGTGATGLPAGFSLQWMTCDDFAANGNQWKSSDDPLLCHASFSGNANLSRYNLLAGQCVTVRIGDLLLDEGASTNCTDHLLCGTCYVFRAFGHATNTLNRSDFTATLPCSTASCHDEGECDPCVRSFGFWLNHYPDAWPADVLANGLTVGCQTYTADQLESILNATPAGGNALVALAHQVINTRLNLLCPDVSQAYIDAVTADLAAAEALMCSTGAVPPVGSGSLTGAQAGDLTKALDAERAQFECSDEE